MLCSALLSSSAYPPPAKTERERERETSHPTTNGGVQNESSVGIRTHCTHVFARLDVDLYAQSVLIIKISASELSRKFIKSALLLVGQGLLSARNFPRSMSGVGGSAKYFLHSCFCKNAAGQCYDIPRASNHL